MKIHTPHVSSIDAAIAGEAVALLVAAPLLYFPSRFPAWGAALGIMLLIAGMYSRRRALGCWFVSTPINWLLGPLFFVALPLGVWAAPGELRTEYAIPRALILIWNGALFYFVVAYLNQRSPLRSLFVWGFIVAGTAVAVAALFGTQWTAKAPALSMVLSRLPRPLVGVFDGAETGFSANQLAGTLLYVVPLAIALIWQQLIMRHKGSAIALGASATAMILVLLASQSRAGLAGFALSLILIGCMSFHKSRTILLWASAGAVLALLFLPVSTMLLQLDAATGATSGDQGMSMAGRLEIWDRAVSAIGDFPLTGVGLGAFRKIAPVLYPLFAVARDADIAHAHNFFLQSGVDMGVLGLVIILAIYLLAVVMCAASILGTGPLETKLASVGLIAALGGQAFYSLFDAVALGSKTNVFFWYLLALIVGLLHPPKANSS